MPFPIHSGDQPAISADGWGNPGSTTRLVGRDAELRTLEAEMALARSGQCRLVLIEGPRGIGKSFLAECFLAPQGSTPVRVSACALAANDELELVAQLSLAIRRGAGNRLGPAAPPLPDLSADPVRGLAELIGALERPDPACPGDRPSGEHLLTLVVDNAQWADPASLGVLELSLRRLADIPLLVLVIAQPDAARLEGLSRHASQLGRILALDGLTPIELGELAPLCVQEELSRSCVLRLWSHTRGNPADAIAILTECPLSVIEDPDADLPAPRALAMAALGRLSQLGFDAQRLVTATAVLGTVAARLTPPTDRPPTAQTIHPTIQGSTTDIDLGLVARLAEVGEPLSPLEQASGSGLLRCTSSVGSIAVSLPDPMTTAAIYQSLGPARRSELHRRATALMADSRAAAYHLLAASFAPDEAVAAELAGLARRSSLQDNGAGIRDWLAAARLSPDRETSEQRLLESARLMALEADLDHLRIIEARLVTCPADPRRSYGLGALMVASGRLEEGVEHLSHAWGAMSAAGDRSAARDAAERLCLAYSMRPSAGGDPASALRWARRASTAGPTPFLAATLLEAGLPGDVAELLAALGDRPVIADPSTLCARGILRVANDDLCEARQDLLGALEHDQGSRKPDTWRYLLPSLALAERGLGSWDDSLSHAQEAIASARQVGELAVSAEAIAATIHAWRGKSELAELHAAVCARGAERSGLAVDWTRSACIRARLIFAGSENPAEVLEALSPVLALGSAESRMQPAFVSARMLSAEALIALRQPDAALELLMGGARPASLRSQIEMARLLGMVEAAQGKTEQARETFASGLAPGGQDEYAYPFARASLMLAYGGFLRRLGQRRDAASLLRSAAHTFTRLRAAVLLQACQREASACGLEPTKRLTRDRSVLTPTEAWVAELAASGLTNAEVAAKLFVSAKTVEYHLGNVYQKLKVSKRSELRAHQLKWRPMGPDGESEKRSLRPKAVGAPATM